MKKMVAVIAISLVCAGCQTFSSGAKLSVLDQLVVDQAKEKKVPPEFALGVVKVESGMDPNAYYQGNYGLGQIRCGTAKGIGFEGKCKDLLDPETNLHYSMIYLRMALDQTNNNWCHAATLYNRGLGAKPKETAYCKKVLKEINGR